MCEQPPEAPLVAPPSWPPPGHAHHICILDRFYRNMFGSLHSRFSSTNTPRGLAGVLSARWAGSPFAPLQGHLPRTPGNDTGPVLAGSLGFDVTSHDSWMLAVCENGTGLWMPPPTQAKPNRLPGPNLACRLPVELTPGPVSKHLERTPS